MAGLYIHVPFCHSRCIYCDFYSTVSGEEWKLRYTDALLDEMAHRSSELHGQHLSTVYLGGGTPSQLSMENIRAIFDGINRCFSLDAAAEVTMEANPDDVTATWLTGLKSTPVNRISMGVQTFSDALLRVLQRRHTSAQAAESVAMCRKYGYSNVSVDLIYGLPGQSMEMWQEDVDRALSLGVKHLSAYALSYEEGTPLMRMLENGDIEEMDEELSWRMYEYLLDATSQAGMEHYEISNFCVPGFHSRHNSSYWHGVPYLGLGPGAHSYDGGCVRRENLCSLAEYVKAAGDVPNGREMLTEQELYDEKVMTGLRTSAGLLLSDLTETQRDYCMRMASPHLDSGKLTLENGGVLKLSRSGIFTSNDIISDLMC